MIASNREFSRRINLSNRERCQSLKPQPPNTAELLTDEASMAALDQHDEHARRERAYYIWEREGRPEGQADDHWRQAERDEQGNRDDALMEDEEKILAGRSNANMPALLTKDVPGG